MKPVPEQKFGGHSDNEFREACTTRQDAIRLYEVACKNLLADWEKICNKLFSAGFTLCDTSGRPVIRLPKEKDYIKIDIPGPGLKEGDGQCSKHCGGETCHDNIFKGPVESVKQGIYYL